MEDQSTRPPLVTISTQTEENNNYGKGRDPIQQDLHPQIFPLSNDTERMPDYRKHLSKVFGEEFLAEATTRSLIHTHNKDGSLKGVGQSKKNKQVFPFAT